MKYITFTLSILFYFIGMSGLFFFILWMGQLLPFYPFQTEATIGTIPAILKNTLLIILFGLQHSIMARPAFKAKWTKIIPKHLERGIFVALSGTLCALIAWQWAPIDGTLWKFESGTFGYYFSYSLFFLGIIFLVSSTFIINHFELFGLQQSYHNLKGKITPAHSFTDRLYYKLVRHPIYTGLLFVFWSSAHMSISRFALALGLTLYIYIGIYFEEKDLISNFGYLYEEYKKRVPKVIPFLRKV